MKALWIKETLTLAVLLPLAACNGTIYPEDGGQSPAAFLVDSFTLAGTTGADCQVSVAGLSDGDGQDDMSWQSTFRLDDGESPASLPGDDGSRWQQSLLVKAVRRSDGQTFYKRVTITFFTGSDGS